MTEHLFLCRSIDYRRSSLVYCRKYVTIKQDYFEKAEKLWEEVTKEHPRFVVLAYFELCDFYLGQPGIRNKAGPFFEVVGKIIEDVGLTSDTEIIKLGRTLWNKLP